MGLLRLGAAGEAAQPENIPNTHLEGNARISPFTVMDVVNVAGTGLDGALVIPVNQVVPEIIASAEMVSKSVVAQSVHWVWRRRGGGGESTLHITI